MGRKTARFKVRGAEFGWSGKRGGRTVEFVFWDEDKLIGTLRISEARLKWKGRYARDWIDIPVDHLDTIFTSYKA